MSKRHFLGFVSLIVILSSCGSSQHSRKERYTAMNSWERDEIKNPDKIFGQSLSLGADKKDDTKEKGIGVNSYLWRASLDTIAFMPLAQVEPFTGVITTDWYRPPGTENERFKVTILVLDRVLRADAVKVSVIYETFEANKGWKTTLVDPQLNEQLEETILARARELKFEVNPR